MGFFDEIIKLFGADEKPSYKIMVLGEYGVVIEGYKKIVSLEENEIILLLKNGGKVSIVGVKLFIKQLEKEEVVISGKILGYSVV